MSRLYKCIGKPGVTPERVEFITPKTINVTAIVLVVIPMGVIGQENCPESLTAREEVITLMIKNNSKVTANKIKIRGGRYSDKRNIRSPKDGLFAK